VGPTKRVVETTLSPEIATAARRTRKGTPNHPIGFRRELAKLACEPGVSVARLALEHGLNTNQLFKWRRAYQAGQYEPPTLLPVEVTHEEGTIGNQRERDWDDRPPRCKRRCWRVNCLHDAREPTSRRCRNAEGHAAQPGGDAARPNALNTEALERIGALYRIEETIRGKPPDERRAHRQTHARPLLDQFRAWLTTTLETLSRKSDTSRAILYALNR
jgi:transposase-like protein